MRTYEQVIEELESARVWAVRGDYFNIGGRELEPHYRDFFSFGQQFLDQDFPEFSIHPARMFFDSDPAVNACARKIHGYSIVEICQGAVTRVEALFSRKGSRFMWPQLIRFEDLFQRLRRYPSSAMTQFLWQYLFYHEVGHLVQYTAHQEFDRTEFNFDVDNGIDSFNSHLKEFDADWFAAYHLALHIQQLIEEYPDRTAAKSVAADIASVVVAAIYVFFIDRSAAGSGFFLERHTHPHATVRFGYMVLFVLENLANFSSYQTDRMEVLQKAESISEVLMQEGGANLAIAFNEVRSANAVEIDRYIRKLMGAVLKDSKLTINILRKESASS
jgi:hypothetical protein